MSVDSYYYWKTGFFTPYKIIANKYPDNTTIITLYRSGSKKLRNYYIGKLEVDSSGAVVKELYNERVIDTKSEVHSEFGELIEHWKIIKQASDEYR